MKQGSAKKDQDGDIDADVKPYMKPCRGRGFQNDATRLMIVRANVPYWPDSAEFSDAASRLLSGAHRS